MKRKIALAQISAGQDRESNIAKGLSFLEKAAVEGADLICFPEMSFCPFFPQYHAEKKYFDWAEPVPGQLTARFQDQCDKNSIAAVINMYERGAKGQYFDCSPVIDNKGVYLGKSQMMHIAELPNYNEKYYYWEGKTEYPAL